jgi:S-formylglutathione hydrolase FrmB
MRTLPLARPLVSLAVLLALALPAWAGGFVLRFDAALQAQPFSERVYVVLTQEGRDGREALGDWFRPPQIFALDARSVPAGGEVRLERVPLAFPKAWADVPPGRYSAVAVARRNLDSPSPGQGAGDLYSEPATIDWPLAADVSLTLARVVQDEPFKESDRVKYFEVPSPLLSAFHGRPITLRAGVILPKNFATEPDRTYPALYFIGGFGGDHRDAHRFARRLPPDADNTLIIVPDASNYWGHSVFADSANTGPWGRALTEELIPAVEARFRGPAAGGGGSGGGEQRYVTGISSGGWSSLWLQVTYPDHFAGVWSHVPDPVDFHDFQRIDLYAPDANMYTDPKGNRRPLARFGETVSLHYDDFVRMETVLGPGGQIQSFEAVFSPKAPDGRPRPLFSRDSGAVDPVTADSWKPYDIRLTLERQWPTLAPRLKGKIRVYAGEVDTFYLEGAVRRLAETMKPLDPSAEIIIVPGMAHTIHQPGMQAMWAEINRRANQP